MWAQGRRPSPGQAVPDRPPPKGEAGLRWWNWDTLYIVPPNYLLPPPGEGGPGASPGRMRAAPGGSVAGINSLEKTKLRAAHGGSIARINSLEKIRFRAAPGGSVAV